MNIETAFVLATPDADELAQFFIDKLGFETRWRVAGQWHSVQRSGCEMMIGSCPDQIHPSGLGDHSYFAYFRVPDVDAFYAEVSGRGVEAPPPEDKPWEMREFPLTLPDGHRLMVGQGSAHE